MNTNPAHPFVIADEDIVTFGSLQLNRAQRLLLKGGRRLAIGGRAMEVLLALTERAGVLMSNRELLQRVWPNVVVAEGTIRVHVALLRKVLRNAEPGSDYVQNISGRGYRFVAPLSSLRRSSEFSGSVPSGSTVVRLPLRQVPRRNNLPLPLTSIFGRDQTIRTLCERMSRERFLTITGPGGSGKSRVAIAVADSLAPTHTHGVCFVDLASVTESQRVSSAVAAALGVSCGSANPLPEILACLSKQPVLLVLDNCEHMIDAATRLAESVLRHSPQARILATSREPLRASGEFAYELTPLETPAAYDEASRAELMQFPAVQLFVERAGAHAGTEFDDDDLSLVADICRRLAGNPLALEIAAAHVRWLGLRSLATGLHEHLYLSIEGHRTADPRHRTLRANFDWSYDLLSPTEQAVFRRLAVFAGSFDPDRAAAVIADERLTHRIVSESLINLARKSLLAADPTQDEVLYRLQDLSRAYAREKLHQAQELPVTHRRHSQIWRKVGAAQIHAHARLWQLAERGVGSIERYLTPVPSLSRAR